jgi:peptide/nickel transport system substrate-binding protein
LRAYEKGAIFLLTTLLFFLIAGCGGSSRIMREEFSREKTLYVGGFQWVKPGDFNPLSSQPSFPVSGNVNLVYENLFGYNMLTGNLEPILAKKYDISDSVLTVELNENARWSDGVPLTAADVIYTFYLHKKYPTSLSSHWHFIDTVYAENNLIRFKMNKGNYNPLVMRDIIGTTLILPKHVFEKIEREAIASAAIKNSSQAILQKMRERRVQETLVASGPYKIHSYGDDFIALERNDNYWGNSALYDGRLPAPQFIVHPIYSSNDDYNRALTEGYLDLSQTFFAYAVESNDNIGKWSSFYIPGSITALFINFGDSVPEFSPNPALKSVHFRRAVAHAINYEKIRQVAVRGYVPEIRPGFIVDDNNEKLYYSAEDAAEYGVAYDPVKAREILKNAGFSWNKKGELLLADDSKIREIRITSPKGWSDWESAVKIIVENLKAIGIPAIANFCSDEDYWRKLSLGYFDMIMHTPRPEQSSSLPWSRFDAAFATQSFEPLSVASWSNQGRYRNPEVERLLVKIPTLKDETEIREAYHELNRIFMKNLPVIPIMYRPSQYYQFSTKYWTNFPTDENPYAPPQLLMTAGGVKGLWGIEPQKR